jgi:hypothetical protein
MALDFAAIEKILGSNTAQLGLGMLGSGLQSHAAGKRSDADRRQAAEQFKTQALMQLLQQSQGRRDNANRAKLSATRLGDEEAFRARQAFAAQMLPQLRNFSITPGDPAVAAAMPKMSGGFTIPTAGFDRSLTRQFGPGATNAALGRRRAQLDALDPTTSEEEQALLQMIEQGMLAQGSKEATDGGSGFWGKLGKGLLKAAPIAAAFIPGVGPLASLAIGAGAGAASGAIDGGWKGALAGAGQGALTQGVMGKLFPQSPTPLGLKGALGRIPAQTTRTLLR